MPSRFANPAFLSRLNSILQGVSEGVKDTFEDVFYHWRENYC